MNALIFFDTLAIPLLIQWFYKMKNNELLVNICNISVNKQNLL